MNATHMPGILLFVTLFSALGVSCGGKKEKDRKPPEIPEEGPIEQGLFADAYPHLVCELLEECDCGVSYRRCTSALSSGPGGAAHASEFSIVYDPERGRECIDALLASTCETALFRDVCLSVHRSTLLLGETCLIHDSCAGYEKGETFCNQGECTALVASGRAELDGLCSHTCGQGHCTGIPISEAANQAFCQQEDGLRCVENRCRPSAIEGESCEQSRDCQIGLFCEQGVCIPQLAAESSCTSDENLSCEVGTYCGASADGLLCVPARDNGARCTQRRQCVSYLCISGRCTAPDEPELVCDQ